MLRCVRIGDSNLLAAITNHPEVIISIKMINKSKALKELRSRQLRLHKSNR